MGMTGHRNHIIIISAFLFLQMPQINTVNFSTHVVQSSKYQGSPEPGCSSGIYIYCIYIYCIYIYCIYNHLNIREALSQGAAQAGSTVSATLEKISTPEEHPTYHRFGNGSIKSQQHGVGIT